MKLLRFRETITTGEILARVHLDTTKVDVNGVPDPDWVSRYSFSSWTEARLNPVNQGQTRQNYLARIRQIIQQQAGIDLAAKIAVAAPTETSLAGEGDIF